MESLLKDIEKAIQIKSYYSALALTLTLPDVINRQMNKRGEKEYIAWIETYCDLFSCKKEKFTILLDNQNKIHAGGLLSEQEKQELQHEIKDNDSLVEIINLDGNFIYKLRCAVLHAGNTKLEIKGNNQDLKIELGVTDEESLKRYSPIMIGYSTEDGPYAKIDVEILCKEIINGMRKFLKNNSIEVNSIYKIEDFNEYAETNKIISDLEE